MEMAFIWDLDGTLVDSYPAIVSSLQELLHRHDLKLEDETVLDFVKRKSVHEFLSRISRELGVEFSELKAEYSAISAVESVEIRAMPGAGEVLAGLAESGATHFVYTHKGDSAMELLERLGLRKYFREIVTGSAGFRRKPDSQAVCYLMEKYGLNAERVCYVGDRELDVRCADNAGIQSILLDGGYCRCKASHVVNDLFEICSLFSGEEKGAAEESTEYA